MSSVVLGETQMFWTTKQNKLYSSWTYCWGWQQFREAGSGRALAPRGRQRLVLQQASNKSFLVPGTRSGAQWARCWCWQWPRRGRQYKPCQATQAFQYQGGHTQPNEAIFGVGNGPKSSAIVSEKMRLFCNNHATQAFNTWHATRSSMVLLLGLAMASKRLAIMENTPQSCN